MGKRNIHILIEKFFEKTTCPRKYRRSSMPGCLTGIFRKRKKRRWLLYGKRNLPWQTNPLSRNYPDYISGSKHPIGCFTSQLAYISRELPPYYFCRCLVLSGTYYYLTKSKSGCGRSSIEKNVSSQMENRNK